MVTSHIERLMGRRQIDALIRSDPIELILRRRAKIDVPGGGWRFGSETSLPPQTVTLTPFKRRMSEFVVGTELGEIIDGAYVVLGYSDLDIKRDDRFTHAGQEFTVVQVDIKTEVRTAAIVDYFGAKTSG